MFDFSKFLDIKTIALGILVLISTYFYYENKALERELKVLELKNLHLEGETKEAKNIITKQNEAFKELELNFANADIKDIKAFEELDKLNSENLKTCENELEAFKNLFKIMAGAK